MADTTGKLRCMGTCWTVGALAGVLGGVLLVVLGGLSTTGAVFLAVLITLVLGLFLTLTLCKPLPTSREVQARHRAATAGAQTTAPSPAPMAHRSADAAPMPSAAHAAATTPASADSPAAKSSTASTQPLSAAGHAAIVTREPSAATDGRPPLLSTPRDGRADDLKRIRGVGPGMEKMLNDMGVYHFDQIAHWNTAEVAWVDDNLEGFKGRVSRDGWVDQARHLASGETAVSQRVEPGDAP